MDSITESLDGDGSGHAAGTAAPEAEGEAEARPVLLKQHRASVGKKVTARKSLHGSSTSLSSLSSQITSLRLDGAGAPEDEVVASISNNNDNNPMSSFQPTVQQPNVQAENLYTQHSLFVKVFDWLQDEKSKRATRKQKTKATTAVTNEVASGDSTNDAGTAGRRNSQTSEGSAALNNLEQILAQYTASSKETSAVPTASIVRRKSSSTSLRRKGLRRGSLSDSDYADVEASVPSADVVLDNTKTLMYTGDDAEGTWLVGPSVTVRVRDLDPNWATFKAEILRLTHTLGFKGWRRIPLDMGADISVVRLSGALTNAVYVVSPPNNLAYEPGAGSSTSLLLRKPPAKLLLRVYGPQVEHLIDREKELQVMRRLGKRNIGPRVLGTFNNGRFEQYFNARTLTTQDLRKPETSKQIAKRMRELHDGIDLLNEEREGGPQVWNNWDKWLDRCEKVISWLDNKVISESAGPDKAAWRERGFVCGIPWPEFRRIVGKYREWLETASGGPSAVQRRLIFAHNDTQNGNLLRLEPSGESPLLLPKNEHKQLVVIDFEYASANTRGFEFSNHFTEWCYDYHHPSKPWKCNTEDYPSPEEQERFLRAYLAHVPNPVYPPPPSSSFSPYMRPVTVGAPPLPANPPYVSNQFSLDTYDPSQGTILELEDREQEPIEHELQRLMRETHIWRAASSAQWVAWGIVQAQVPSVDEEEEAKTTGDDEKHHPNPPAGVNAGESSVVSSNGGSEDPEGPDEFDYLAYAQDRALFFLADALSFGLVTEEELPANMLPRIKQHLLSY
ncbi:hypothetical protein AJ80_01835 [Polytolypa hystricis UAMH7299]|uniref:Choline kinase N-terminal domain-containing protein n=1 Tax=Polytolypa hystricis (strain UAMH7299) TaxID=1447883 RepID=A0A2B7YZN6_POLH7|nr:hypothetical protein AJ80_01835 [Polytolypa hystricis UAMH7299]